MDICFWGMQVSMQVIYIIYCKCSLGMVCTWTAHRQPSQLLSYNLIWTVGPFLILGL